MKHDTTDRKIELEATVEAPLPEVWQAWVTSDGVAAWLVQHARVELAVGGPFEIYFSLDAPEGLRGSEACTILSYAPQQMLSFTWNAPPSIPELRKLGPCTWVVVTFTEEGPRRTRLRLTQFGIHQGSDWDRYLEYFQNAWPRVLAACERHFRGG